MIGINFHILIVIIITTIIIVDARGLRDEERAVGREKEIRRWGNKFENNVIIPYHLISIIHQNI